MGVRMSQKHSTVSRLITGQDLKTFWERFNDIFPSERTTLWDSLLHGMKQYHQLLKERKAISEDVVKLRQENLQLRRLLLGK